MEKNVRKIDIIYFIVYFADALVSPFLALFFLSLGYEGTKQGILLALIPLSNLLGNLLYGKLSFNLRKNLRIVSALAAVECFVLMFYGFLNNFVFLIIFTIIFAFHNNPFYSIEDGIACKLNDTENKNYAITRMFGSIGYLVAVLIGGLLIDWIDYKFTFIIAGILFGIGSFLFYLIKPVPEQKTEKVKISFKELFTKKEFIFYSIFYLLVLGSWQVGEAYLSTYFTSLGLSVDKWGYCYAGQIVFEVITILLTNKIFSKDKNLIWGSILSCSLMVCRSFILSLNLPLVVLICLELPIRGIAWGIFLDVNVNLLKKIVSSDLVAKAVTFLAIVIGVFTTIFEYACPNIFSSFSPLYLVLASLEFIGLLILIKFELKFDKKTE